MSSRARTQARKASKDGPEIGKPIHLPPNGAERFGVARMLIRREVKS